MTTQTIDKKFKGNKTRKMAPEDKEGMDRLMEKIRLRKIAEKEGRSK